MNWVILRCASRHTLGLAAGLCGDGVEAWTPVEHRVIRKPRWNVHREVTLALLPTFVFADADRREDLLRLSALTRKAQPDFSLFHYFGRLPIVEDAALDDLRLAESRAVPVKLRGRYSPGDAVRITKGAMQGLCGVVERDEGKGVKLLVTLFGRTSKVTLEAFYLKSERQRMAA